MKRVLKGGAVLVRVKSEGSILGACDSCIHTGQRKEGGTVKDPPKNGTMWPLVLREERACGRHPGKDMMASWGGKVVLWILPSPHEVGGFIMMLFYQVCFFCFIKVCFFNSSARTNQQIVCGCAGQTVCLAVNNWEEINIENVMVCKATPLQLSLVRTPLLRELFRALCIVSKLPFSSKVLNFFSSCISWFFLF